MPPRRKPSEPFAWKPEHRTVLLVGAEPFVLRERSREIAAKLRDVHGEIQVFEFDGATADLATVLDEVRSYGLLQQHKLVIVDRADEWLKGEGREAWRDALIRHAAAPVEDATLLLRADTWPYRKLRDAIAKHGHAHAVQPLGEADAIAWCGKRCAKAHGTTIEREAAEILVQRTGTDLARLDAELAKLASFTGPGRPIDAAAVAELVGLSREQQAWIIQSAVLDGDAGKSLRTLHELAVVARDPARDLPVPVGWALTDLARKLHAAARLRDQGATERDVAQHLRLWGPSARSVPAVAARVGAPRLAALLETCVERDRLNKRGHGRPMRSLEALTVLVSDTIGGR